MANEIKQVTGAGKRTLYPPEYARALREEIARRIVENRRKLEDAKLERESKDAERW